MRILREGIYDQSVDPLYFFSFSGPGLVVLHLPNIEVRFVFDLSELNIV
jgi:hypothetical protein